MAGSVPIPSDDSPTPFDQGEPGTRPPLLTPLRELELVDAFRKGDTEAVAILLRAYQRRMYGICYRMLRNEEDARDLTQDSMIRVMEGLTGFDSRAQLSTWIIRITINTCISHIRKRKLRTHASIDQPLETDGSAESTSANQPHSGRSILEGGEPDPAHRVEMEETRRVLLRSLDRLEPIMRAVIILRDMQGLDYQQIAEVVEVPVGTVKSRLFRARAALRDLIEAAEGDKKEQ